MKLRPAKARQAVLIDRIAVPDRENQIAQTFVGRFQEIQPRPAPGIQPGLQRGFARCRPVTLNYAGTSNAEATCVFVTGTDVYVGGLVVNPSTSEWNARYWKNGTLVSLPDGPKSSKVNGMYVDGTDVYAAGFEENASRVKAAKIWKNGAPYTISEPTAVMAEAYAVFVK